MKLALLTTDNREHERDYGAREPRFGQAVTALLEGFAQLPELKVHVISCTQQPLTSPKTLAANLYFHSLLVPKLGWLRTGYQGCIRAVRRKIRELQPDLIHGQGTERDCAISAVFSGRPNVLTIHGNMAELARLFRPPFGSFGWLVARLENFTLPRTAGVLCNSAYTENLVKPRVRRTWRVPNAIREMFFAPCPAPPSLALPALLNVGVVSPRKRQLELLQAARELHGQGLEFSLHFIGQADPDDSYASAFLQQIRALEPQGWARFLGTQSSQELIRSFDAAAALVHFPSEEAFGLVVAEALARDLKLFAARTGGIPDICAGAPGVELFDPNDWAGLTSALARCLRAGSPRPAGAAELMRARYHPEIIARRHLEIYREVLAN